jgi:hypothetical protein
MVPAPPEAVDLPAAATGYRLTDMSEPRRDYDWDDGWSPSVAIGVPGIRMVLPSEDGRR